MSCTVAISAVARSSGVIVSETPTFRSSPATGIGSGALVAANIKPGFARDLSLCVSVSVSVSVGGIPTGKFWIPSGFRPEILIHCLVFLISYAHFLFWTYQKV